MEFIKSPDPKQGIEATAKNLSSALRSGRKVLWLVCGGSNIPGIVKTMDVVRAEIEEAHLPNLTVSLTDERYGVVGHRDSNWSQLADMGFNLRKVNAVPVLVGKSLDATVGDYSSKLKGVMEETESQGGLIAATFGIGSDSHIAGILPNSPACSDTRYVSGYEAGPFIRITITPSAIKKIHVAYAFAFGPAKKEAMRRLTVGTADANDEPVNILHSLPQAHVYSDQI